MPACRGRRTGRGSSGILPGSRIVDVSAAVAVVVVVIYYFGPTGRVGSGRSFRQIHTWEIRRSPQHPREVGALPGYRYCCGSTELRLRCLLGEFCCCCGVLSYLASNLGTALEGRQSRGLETE